MTTNLPGGSGRSGWLQGVLQRRRRRMAFMKAVGELKMLVKATAATDENEIGCDEAYESLDEFADIVARGDDPSGIMPLVQHHLDMCGNCREEFDALLRVLRA